MYSNKHIILLGCIVAILSGCGEPRGMYVWGDYQRTIHSSYKNPGSIDTLTEIDSIENNIILAAQMNKKKVPPGVYTHLAVLYIKVGKMGKALDAFAKEKQLFPESTVFIDGMMRRAGVKQ